MPYQTLQEWDTGKQSKEERQRAAAAIAKDKVFQPSDAVALLEAVIRPGDIVVLEGDNQKQAAALSKALAAVNPEAVHDLHMVMSCTQMEDRKSVV